MATTTAAITLTSDDLLTDALSLSATNTLYKAGTTTGLDQTTGMTKAYLTATQQVDIFPVNYMRGILCGCLGVWQKTQMRVMITNTQTYS